MIEFYSSRIRIGENMKRFFKKVTACILAAVLCLVPLICTVAAASDYPDGVTAKKAKEAVSYTDKLVSSVCKTYMNTSLKNMLVPVLYNSETLSALLVGIYGSIGENASDLKNIGIDISVSAVAECLSGYGEVYNALSAFTDWQDVKLENVNWGVNDRDGFARALASCLAPFNDVLYALLCSGSFKVKFISVAGGNGYETSIIPLLTSLGCKDVLSQEEFTEKSSQDKTQMVYGIVLPVLTLLEEACDTPADSLTEILPRLANFIVSGKLNECINSLTQPIATNKIVEIAVFLKLFELESFEIDVQAMLDESLPKMAEEKGFNIKEIDLSELASCGSGEGNEYTPDKGKAYIEIMRWLIDVLKLNFDKLPELMKQSPEQSIKIPEELLTSLKSVETDKIISLIISLFFPEEISGKYTDMIYPSQTPAQVSYTPNLTKENFDKVLDNIDSVLDEFVKEGAGYYSAGAMLSVQIYTNQNINSVLSGIYKALEEQGLSETLNMLGIDITPSGVASCLTEKGYENARNALKGKKSWSKVSLDGVTWNFYNGNRKGFENALVAIFRPLFPVLRFLLAEDDFVLLDTITVKGADGYNTAIIPVLEALGCDSKKIDSYSQYKKDAGTDGIVKEILDPVFDLLDEVFNKPVYTLTGVLPNIVYFLNSGSLESCIKNLLIPVTEISGKLSDVVKMDFDTSSLQSKLDIKSLSSSLTSGLGFKMPEIDINKLASYGTLVQRSSKSVVDGKTLTYSYVEADRTAVLISALRVLAEMLKMPENATMMTSVMGDNSAMDQYSSTFTQQFETMTADETIEWLYNLLFKERVTKVIKPESEVYSPNIIYEAPKSYEKEIKAGVAAGLVLLAGVAVLVINRKRIFGEDGVSVEVKK